MPTIKVTIETTLIGNHHEAEFHMDDAEWREMSSREQTLYLQQVARAEVRARVDAWAIAKDQQCTDADE